MPGKNIRPLAGKPLLAYSIEISKICKNIDNVFVSTDDHKIKSVALEYGAQVIVLPTELAQDDTPEWLAWKHAVEWLEGRREPFNVFLSLPTTSPLRNKNDVSECIKCLDEKTDAVVTISESSHSPWFNMVRESEDGFIDKLIKSDVTYIRRQDTPKIYNLTTVAYVTRPEFIKTANGVFEGRVKGVKIPAERAQDIDTELDFKIAEFLMCKRLSKI